MKSDESQRRKITADNAAQLTNKSHVQRQPLAPQFRNYHVLLDEQG
jgi:hypothetical protein